MTSSRNILKFERRPDCQGERSHTMLHLEAEASGCRTVPEFIIIDTLLSQYDPDWPTLTLVEKATRRDRMRKALNHSGLL